MRLCLGKANRPTAVQHSEGRFAARCLKGGAPALPEALAPAPIWNLADLFRVICALVHTSGPLTILFSMLPASEARLGNLHVKAQASIDTPLYNNLLRRLRPDDYAMLAPHLEERRRPVGDLLYSPGDNVELVY